VVDTVETSVMTKHVFNEVITWDKPTELLIMKNLCEKCGLVEGETYECTPIKVNLTPGYLDKALKALAKAS
jgi:hypothetical protein